MSLLGKITGIFLLLLGALVILAGVYAAASALAGNAQPSTDALGDIISNALGPVMGIAIMIFGLITAALGQGLYLLAQVAENTRENYRRGA
jgi:hypothetical protein